nr:30S ribosomal protein S16 [Rhabdothermincola salaria]
MCAVPGHRAPGTPSPSTTTSREKNAVVKLRLMRMGKTKQPTYRIVAADARSPRNGRFIEILGHYDPRREPSAITVDNDKAVAWLKKGAQPTEAVAKLLKISGAMDDFAGTAS